MLDNIIKKGIYKHFKGGLYEVLYLAKDTETLNQFVVYKNVNKNQIWIRNKKKFLDLIEIKGKKISRFKYIGNETYKTC